MQGVLAEERRRWEAERAEEVKRLRLELEQGMTRAHEETGRERDLVEKHLLQISQLKKVHSVAGQLQLEVIFSFFFSLF